jgi:hypothetical protein
MHVHYYMSFYSLGRFLILVQRNYNSGGVCIPGRLSAVHSWIGRGGHWILGFGRYGESIGIESIWHDQSLSRGGQMNFMKFYINFNLFITGATTTY